MGLIRRAILIVALMTPAALAASPAAAATGAPRHYDCSKAGNTNKAACKSASAAASGRATATKTRNYDCTKPGNANKAACKGATSAATPSRMTTTATTTKTTTRQYDCTKAGNANKTACKTAGAQTHSGKSSGAVKTTTKTTSTTTDCAKWYNRLRAVCRTSSASSSPRTTVAPAAKPVATTGSGESINNNPAGAVAQCKDGSYSHAKTHSGACSHHGGVAKWMS